MRPKQKSKGIVFLEHSFIANAEIWIDIGDQSLGEFYNFEKVILKFNFSRILFAQ